MFDANTLIGIVALLPALSCAVGLGIESSAPFVSEYGNVLVARSEGKKMIYGCVLVACVLVACDFLFLGGAVIREALMNAPYLKC